ncbi:MAG: hypothetical protein R6X18_11585 [Chloroflexota bacterium]|jgi:hypothetical protein
MATQDRVEILDMLSAGKITATEALALLEGSDSRTSGKESVPSGEKSEDFFNTKEVDEIKADEQAALDDAIKIENVEKPAKEKELVSQEMEMKPRGNGYKPHWLKIRIRDMSTGRNKVSVNLPIGMVTFGLRVAQRFNADMGEVNIDELLSMIKQGEHGLLVEVQDDEDNEQVQIYLD